MTGICECCAISGSASASSWLGQATRTMSQPVAVSSAICWSVALTSEVSVVVIDWTEIGRLAADADLADLDLAGLAARGEHRRRRLGHAQVDLGHAVRLLASGCAIEDLAGAGVRRGRRRSAPRPSPAGTTPRRRRSGSSLATSTYPGSGRPRSRAKPRRSASQSAPAMWPPSSGSSGMKLNMPMKKLKPAISISRKTAFSGDRELARATTVSPASRPPPTMLTGLSLVALLDADDRLGDAPDLDRAAWPAPGRCRRSCRPSARACRPGRRWSRRAVVGRDAEEADLTQGLVGRATSGRGLDGGVGRAGQLLAVALVADDGLAVVVVADQRRAAGPSR